VRPSRRASVQKQSGSDEPKTTSAKGSNKDAVVSGSKHSSNKDDSKPNSKPASGKAASNDKAADANKAAEDSKPNSNGAQNPSTPVFTAEEDAKLLLMKSEGKPWPEIAAAINKTKKQNTRRFGEIKPADWQPQKGGKHGIDKVGVSDEKNDKSDKKVAKMDKKSEERKTKSNAIDKHKKEQALSAALLVAGKVEHAHAHRHEVHVNHHVHGQESHPHRSTKEAHPRRHNKDTHRPRDTHNSSQPKSHHPPPPSVAASSHIAYTLATTPSLTEDDLFSFGELQALSELIGKDMQAMWQRVSAAFFGMTGRRIAAEDIRDKFEGLDR
jgi:hypothetical protein